MTRRSGWPVSLPPRAFPTRSTSGARPGTIGRGGSRCSSSTSEVIPVNREQAMKIGLLVGRENTFPQAFIEYLNGLGQDDVTAEFCRLGGTRMGEVSDYRVIIDRISHEVPYYRSYLKNAVLQGTVVINDPFWWSTDDKFFECCLS